MSRTTTIGSFIEKKKLLKIVSCINLQLYLSNSDCDTKSIILDMHYRITYMYINFQQNLVCRSVKTVYTNLFAKNRKLHKFATIYQCYNFEEIIYNSDMHHPIT